MKIACVFLRYHKIYSLSKLRYLVMMVLITRTGKKIFVKDILHHGLVT